MHRRTFTKLGIFTGASALVLPSWPVVVAADTHAIDLTADERALLERFSETMLPTEGTPLKPRQEVPVVDNIAHALSLLDPGILEQIRVGFKLFDYGAIVIGFHFARFVNLGDAERVAYIRRWENGATVQRGVVDLLKKLTYMGYWQDIEAGRAIGYRGPVSVEGGIPSLGNAPMPNEEVPT